MKRVSIFLTMLAVFAFAQNSMSVVGATIDEGTDAVTITVQMDNTDLVRGFQFNIASDPSLGDPSVSAGADLPGDFSIAGSPQGDGSYMVMAYVIGTTDIPAGSNIVVDLAYSGLASFAAGDYALTFSGGVLSDGAGQPLACDWIGGALTIAGAAQPPVANSGGPYTVEDSDDNGIETVTLDGSGSYDPDGLISEWAWSWEGPGAANIFITEIADPNNASGARFVEIYNAGDEDVDLGAGWALQRWTNDSVDPQSPVSLTGVIVAGGFYIISNNASTFESTYGFAPNQDIGTGGAADSNGDDNLALLDATTAIVDLYGVPGEDGTGTAHEFEDGRAERVATVIGGNPIWDVAEWNIDNDSGGGDGYQDAPGGFDPGSWIGAARDTYFAYGETVDVDFPVGETTVTLTVTDDSGLTATEVTTVTVTEYVVPTLTIYEIQGQADVSPFAGQVVETSGIVTATDGGGKNFIQDGAGAWNGIYIYDYSNTYTVGDDITIVALANEYYDQTQLKDVVSVVVESSGNAAPAAAVLTTFGVNDEAYEGVLVAVEGAECTNVDLGNGEWEINDGTGAVVVDDMYFAYTPVATKIYNVTGAVAFSYGAYKIEPRDEGDVIDVTPAENHAPVAVAGDDFEVMATETGFVTVALDGSASYDIDGDALTYSWMLDAIEVATTASFDYELGVGVFTFTLTVNDGEFDASDDVLVTITEYVVPPTTILFEDFEVSEGGFTSYSVASDKDWYRSSYSGNYFMKISGYGGDTFSDDWLYTPAMNFDLFTDEILSFGTMANYDGPVLQVKVSNDFVGGDPAGATWTDLSGFALSAGDYAYVESGDIDVSGFDGLVTFAFHYLTDETGSTTWEVDDVLVTGYAAEVMAATPVILPAGDFCLAPVEVSISCETAGASIYYTLDGADPSDASTLYAGAFTLDASTTVKAIAYADGYLASLIASETYVFPTDVTIYDIQGQVEETPYIGQIVRTSGIVTAVDGSNYWVQDGAGAWNGILVYDGGNTAVIGDEAVIVAEVDEYYGCTELVNIVNYEVVSAGNALPAAEVLATGAVADEAFEGVLIATAGVCDNPDMGNGEWSIDDGSGPATVDDKIFAFTALLGHDYDVTGVLNYSWGAYKMCPRDEFDIIDSTPQTADFTISDGAGDAGGQVTLTLSVANTVELGGIQIDLLDTPDALDVVYAAGVGRAEGADCAVSTLGNGGSRLIMYFMSGGSIEAGEGGVVEFTFDIAGDFAGTVNIAAEGVIASDIFGDPVDATAAGCVVEVAAPPAVVYVNDGEGEAGGSVTLAVGMDNLMAVSGVQLDLVDAPDALTITGATGIGRAEGADCAVSTLANGGSRLILYFMSGGSIEAGTGDFVELTFDIGTDYVGDVAIAAEGLVLSDIEGNPIAGSATGATVSVFTSDVFEVTIGTGTADAGAQLTISLDLENTADVGGLQLDIADAGGYLSNPSAIVIGGAAAMDLGVSSPSAGVTRILLYSMSGGAIAPGVGAIVELTWDVAGDAAEGAYALAGSGFIVSDPAGNALDGTLIDGSYEVLGAVEAYDLTIGSGSADAGAQLTISLGLENTGDVGGLQIDITDAGGYLSNPAVVGVGGAASMNLGVSSPSAGVTRILLYSISGDVIAPGDGAIIELTWDVAADAVGGDYALAGASLVISDPIGNPLDGTFTDGSYHINEVFDEFVLGIGSGSAGAGTQLTIGLSLLNTADVGGLQIDIADAGGYLSNPAVVGVGGAASMNLGVSSPSAGVTRVLLYSISGDVIAPGDGEIVQVTWDVLGDAAEGTYALAGSGFVISDPVGNPLDGTFTDGAYTVEVPVVHCLEVNPAALDFGDVFIGESAALTFDVANCGNQDETVFDISSDNADFAVDQTFFAVANGGSATVNVTFTPSAEGAAGGTLILIHSAGDPLFVALAGNGAIANEPPVADAGADQELLIPHDGNPATITTDVTLDGSGSSDPNDDALAYSWTLDGEEVSTEASFTIALEAGGYTFVLAVSDGEFSATDDVAVIVNPEINGAPIADAGDDFTIVEGESAVLDGSGSSDPNGDDITFLWSTGETTVSITIDGLTVGSYIYSLTVTDSYGELSSDDVAITVTPPPHFVPIWSGNPYMPMSFFVFSASFDGIDLEEGDEIGVFDGDNCVGAETVPAGGVVMGDFYIVTSRDDGAGNGFIEGHTVSYRIYDYSEDLETENVSGNYFNCGDGTPADEPTFEGLAAACVELEAVSSVTQVISFGAGWNIFSAYVLPESMDLLDIVQPLIDAGALSSVIDETGARITYFMGTWMNQIGDIQPTEGYYVKVNDAIDLEIEGSPVDLPLTVSLGSGWNIMSYPSADPQDGLAIVQPLIDAEVLVSVIDETGARITYFMGTWMNQIGNFLGGEGYYVKVLDAFDLEIGAGTMVKSAPVELPRLGNHFTPLHEGNPFMPMGVYLTEASIEGAQVEMGDEIALYDGDRCVGSAMFNGDDLFLINASMDDGTNNGFTEGNVITMKIFDSSTGFEYDDVEIAWVDVWNQPIDAPLYDGLNVAFASVNAINVPETFALHQNFPNPFNPSTKIKYDLPTDASVSVTIFNILGESVAVLVNDYQSAGEYVIEWDGSDVASGIYFYKFTAVTENENFSKIMKMVLMK